ncbi:hypothetical protein [Vibrio sp. AND4]|uniref:hypothetical protein n=1 Tax=Vibrio sp. AND4 TaxID=314289 RepID=UPI00015F2C38|nr:hypothetical protein [Vibrio sp. AND4]EDP57959.1 hypothetical protein AND4_05294 [Vibrio sp. AND4]
MSKYIVINGDEVIFQSTFGAATATILSPPPTITGSGHATILGEKVCIDGDESNVKLSCTYKAGRFQTAGNCTLTIDGLASDQIADHTFNGKKVITVGSKFTAKLAVTMPAVNPNNPNDKDLKPSYSGNGTFKNTQSFVTAE